MGRWAHLGNCNYAWRKRNIDLEPCGHAGRLIGEIVKEVVEIDDKNRRTDKVSKRGKLRILCEKVAVKKNKKKKKTKKILICSGLVVPVS